MGRRRLRPAAASLRCRNENESGPASLRRGPDAMLFRHLRAPRRCGAWTCRTRREAHPNASRPSAPRGSRRSPSLYGDYPAYAARRGNCLLHGVVVRYPFVIRIGRHVDQPGHRAGGLRRAPKSTSHMWCLLLVTLVAVALSCLAPDSMLSRPPTSAGAAIVTAPVPPPSGSACAGVACSRGSPSSTVAIPGITLAGDVASTALAVLALCTVRRRRPGPGVLPAGSSSLLLRPPQHLIYA